MGELAVEPVDPARETRRDRREQREPGEVERDAGDDGDQPEDHAEHEAQLTGDEQQRAAPRRHRRRLFADEVGERFERIHEGVMDRGTRAGKAAAGGIGTGTPVDRRTGRLRGAERELMAARTSPLQR